MPRHIQPQVEYEGVLDSIPEHYWHPEGVKGYWSIIKPYGYSIINAARNPSFEFASTSWVNLGSSAWQRSRDAAIHGDIGALVTVTASNGGIGYEMLSQFTTGTFFSANVSVNGPAGTIVTFKFEYVNASLPPPVATRVMLPGYPIRISTRIQPQSLNPTATTLPIGIRFDRPGTYYVDGLVLTSTELPVEMYFDGDSDSATWLGTPHSSASEMSPRRRTIGERFNLNESGFNFVGSTGFGLTPRQLITSPYARLNGAHLQRIKELPRVIVLNGTFEGAPEDMHEARSALIEALSWKFKNQCTEELLLCYSLVNECGCQVSREFQIPVEYQSGLEGNWSTWDRERATLVFVTSGEQSFIEAFDSSAELTLNGTILLENAGDDDVWPEVYMHPGGGGVIISELINDTTETHIKFTGSGLSLAFGQYAILRTNPRKRISLDLVTFAGSAPPTVTRIMNRIDHTQSQIGSFRLIPGINQVRAPAALVSAGNRAFLRWRNRYQTLDHLRPGLCPEVR